MTVPHLAATTEIDATEFGGRQDVLILGPSLGTGAPLWDRMLAGLSRNHAVVRWDLPGHGKSNPTDEPFTMAELATAVIDLADALGVDRFDYAGVSIGGAVALQLALDYPQRLKHSAVVCSAAYLGGPEPWNERADAVRESGTAPLVDVQRPRWFAPETLANDTDMTEALLDMVRAADARSYARCCEAIGGFDVRDRLGEIDVPLLVISGERDPAASPEAGAFIAEHVPGARQVVIASAAHMAVAEKPGECSRALLDFLAE